ncbi:hypothetical protein HQN60_15475 [Deefgea piscis]|uniref:Uncharacterized protein n=1 Tax=Deefgea piscis TaxID=2739061 RepID=A0A6M8SVD1_9NEIS|nr:hypothetical protein [Deefgea piscis]QKJ68008.1 hypothetical protein HQN60_15475 [Deefgea piscis]
MFLLVTLTGASGFVSSYLLLRAGFVEMWLRYLAAFGVAYLMFLFLLWLWLKVRADNYADFPDLSTLAPSGSEHSGAVYCGNGGEFGGGGASASFDVSSTSVPATDESASAVGEALSGVAESEDFAILLAALILVGAMLFSSLFMIYSAPALFAELVVDGVLSASLYRRLRGLETRHWLETALRRTALPFLITAAIVSASGWCMARYAPDAHSIGDVISYAKQGR